MACEKSPERTPTSGVSSSGYGDAIMAARLTRRVVVTHYTILNDTNYDIWTVKIKIILYHLGMYATINGEASVREENNNEAFAAISYAMLDDTMMAIAINDTNKEAWKAIKQMNVRKDQVKKREFKH
ncbi:hypothetical protein ABZP36_021330 [Zizania latifolia]